MADDHDVLKLGDQLFELADDIGVTGDLEVSLQTALEALEPKLLQSGDLVLGEARVRHIGERRPTPETKRLGEDLCRDVRLF